MCQLRILSVIAILIFFLGLTEAKPYRELSRPKRTSDQRLAELETLIALSKMNGKLVTIPIGFGKIDPHKIGRRRRSVGLLLQQLINDLSTEDKLSDEIMRIPAARKEEDGGEVREDAKGGEEEDEEEEEEFLLKGKLNPHLPVRLPE